MVYRGQEFDIVQLINGAVEIIAVIAASRGNHNLWHAGLVELSFDLGYQEGQDCQDYLQHLNTGDVQKRLAAFITRAGSAESLSARYPT